MSVPRRQYGKGFQEKRSETELRQQQNDGGSSARSWYQRWDAVPMAAEVYTEWSKTWYTMLE